MIPFRLCVGCCDTCHVVHEKAMIHADDRRRKCDSIGAESVVVCDSQIETGSLDLDRQSGVARRRHSATMASSERLDLSRPSMASEALGLLPGVLAADL